MSTLRVLLVVAAAAALGLVVRAQAKPDFSGRWVQITPAAEAEGGGSEQLVTQDATTLTTEHPSEGGSHRQVYKLDGESRSMLGQIQIVSKASWEGQKLVITSSATYPDRQRRDSKQIWSLGTDGRLTIEFSATNPDGTATEMRLIHRKK